MTVALKMALNHALLKVALRHRVRRLVSGLRMDKGNASLTEAVRKAPSSRFTASEAAVRYITLCIGCLRIILLVRNLIGMSTSRRSSQVTALNQ